MEFEHKGLHTHRLKQNPLEKDFADEWKAMNDDQRGRTTFDYLLGDGQHPASDHTQRDATVAATFIQWLGSPVGQNFLIRVIEKNQEFQEKLVHDLGANFNAGKRR